MPRHKIYILLFCISVVLNTIGLYTQNLLLQYIFKPLIMLTITLYYTTSVKKVNVILLFAFILSLVGAVLNFAKGTVYFLTTVALELVAHVLFIIVVVKMIKKVTYIQIIATSIPLLLICTSFTYMISEGLGRLLVPVILYIIVIGLFNIVAILFYQTTRTTASLMLLGGVLLFLISDMSIGIQKFYLSHEYFPIVSSLSYIAAQYLICRFMIVNEK